VPGYFPYDVEPPPRTSGLVADRISTPLGRVRVLRPSTVPPTTVFLHGPAAFDGYHAEVAGASNVTLFQHATVTELLPDDQAPDAVDRVRVTREHRAYVAQSRRQRRSVGVGLRSRAGR